MGDHDHPTRDSTEWDNPNYCPFCGTHLTDGGAGFMSHIDEAAFATCRTRFSEWRENVAGDVGGEWGG